MKKITKDFIICWDMGWGKAKIVEHPDTKKKSDRYDMTHIIFRDKFKKKSKLAYELYYFALLIIIVYRVPYEKVHKEFIKIPEYALKFAKDGFNLDTLDV